jgi:hypothetical protein
MKNNHNRPVKAHLTAQKPEPIITELVGLLQFTDWSIDGDAHWKHNQALRSLRELVGVKGSRS